MAIYATASDVATNIGRPLTTNETAQADLWISWAEAAIQARMGDLSALEPNTLQMVLVEAVTARLRRPEPLSQTSVTVDDATVSKTFQRSTGLIEILPQWWQALGWVDDPGAFDVMLAGEPDVSRDA